MFPLAVMHTPATLDFFSLLWSYCLWFLWMDRTGHCHNSSGHLLRKSFFTTDFYFKQTRDLLFMIFFHIGLLNFASCSSWQSNVGTIHVHLNWFKTRCDKLFVDKFIFPYTFLSRYMQFKNRYTQINTVY